MKKCSGHGRCCRPSSYATAYAHAGKISKERIKRSRLLNKISGIRLNFVIAETFKKLPPPPPPTHTHTKGVLFRCACVTYGRKCARPLCGGRGGGSFMTGAAFNMNGGGGGGGGGGRPPQGYARSATESEAIKVCPYLNTKRVHYWK